MAINNDASPHIRNTYAPLSELAVRALRRFGDGAAETVDGETLNLMLDLAQLTINNWSSTSAILVKTTLENPDLNQNQIANILEKTQGNISQGLKRAGFDEILKLLKYYQNQIQTLC